jgi:hypothetical protein
VQWSEGGESSRIWLASQRGRNVPERWEDEALMEMRSRSSGESRGVRCELGWIVRLICEAEARRENSNGHSF